MCAKKTFLNELELKIEARTPIFSFQICNLHPLKYCNGTEIDRS